MSASISMLFSGPMTVNVQRGTCHMCTDCGGPEIKSWMCLHLILAWYVVLMHDIVLVCCNLYLKMHVGLKSSWELMFVLFVNVPTLNKTFDLIWFDLDNYMSFCPFFFWSIYCLSFDLQLRCNLLASSNIS